jgi:hypothetical protein
MAKALTELVTEIMEEREAIEPAQPHFANLQHLIFYLENEPPILTAIAQSDLSAAEYLIFLLCKAYEHFWPEKRAGYSTNPTTWAKSGPFIRFAEAAIAELEIERITPARIAAAVAKVRRLEKRAVRV